MPRAYDSRGSRQVGEMDDNLLWHPDYHINTDDYYLAWPEQSAFIDPELTQLKRGVLVFQGWACRGLESRYPPILQYAEVMMMMVVTAVTRGSVLRYGAGLAVACLLVLTRTVQICTRMFPPKRIFTQA